MVLLSRGLALEWRGSLKADNVVVFVKLGAAAVCQARWIGARTRCCPRGGRPDQQLGQCRCAGFTDAGAQFVFGLPFPDVHTHIDALTAELLVVSGSMR